jgi:NAD(P)-dependent dehydrogenase (short-subunit alcohol dehydrogenase family)
MSRIVVIGATGHVGTFLVPRLVRAGHEVAALSRGTRGPYLPAPEWRAVQRVAVDRAAEDAAGVFGDRIAALAPDAVVDMLCFTPESARQLVVRGPLGREATPVRFLGGQVIARVGRRGSSDASAPAASPFDPIVCRGAASICAAGTCSPAAQIGCDGNGRGLPACDA